VFKRARWTTFGMVVGAGTSVWAQRKVRRTVERYLPEQVSGRTRQLGAEVRAAIAEGRQAMIEREAELRARVEPARPRRPVIEAAAAELPVGAGGMGHGRQALGRRR
jgi:hypothetical protein